MPQFFPWRMPAEHTEKDPRAGFDEPRQISSYPGQVKDTIQTGEIRKRTVKRRLAFQFGEFLGGENAEIEEVDPIGCCCILSSQLDHARRDIASEDRDSPVRKMNSVYASSTVEFQNTRAWQEGGIQLPPNSITPHFPNRGSNEGLLVGLRSLVPIVLGKLQ